MHGVQPQAFAFDRNLQKTGPMQSDGTDLNLVVVRSGLYEKCYDIRSVEGLRGGMSMLGGLL